MWYFIFLHFQEGMNITKGTVIRVAIAWTFVEAHLSCALFRGLQGIEMGDSNAPQLFFKDCYEPIQRQAKSIHIISMPFPTIDHENIAIWVCVCAHMYLRLHAHVGVCTSARACSHFCLPACVHVCILLTCC